MIDTDLGQIILTSVLFSLIGGSLLIRYNEAIAKLLSGHRTLPHPLPESLIDSSEQVLIGGYGRVGHTVAVLMQERGIEFKAFDTDPERVAEGLAEGHPVAYGDISDPELLSAIRAERASLVVMTVDDSEQALRAVSFLRKISPDLPIIVRAKDAEASMKLLEEGATHAYPEAIEASLSLGATALQMLDVASEEVEQLIQSVRDRNYKPILEQRSSRPV